MYKFAHFETPSSTLWKAEYELKNCFGDHFTLLMPLNSQLYWLFGSYGMLIAQIGYILVGAIGIYLLIKSQYKSPNLAWLAVLLFFIHYSLYSALVFDAHDNVYGMMFLPWILYFFFKERSGGFICCLLLFLFAREDLAFTGIFLGISLLFFSTKLQRKLAFACIAVSLAYFIVVYFFIMPPLSSVPWGYNAWRFNELGNSFSDALHTVITKPIAVIKLFFNQQEKLDKLGYFLATGGILTIVRPKFIFIFIPTFLITCLSSDWPLWGNMYHYNIVFAVVLPILVVSVAGSLEYPWKHVLLAAVLASNIVHLQKTRFHDWSRFGRIFTAEYYERRENTSEIYEAIKMIPAAASVSASNHLTPHLAFREKAYFFPDIKDAEYIVLNEADTIRPFPFPSAAEFRTAVQQVRARSDFELVYEKSGVLVFKKIDE